MKKEWTDIPQDVHEAIRRVRRFLRFLAWRLSDDEYMAGEMASTVLAMYCDNEADWLDELLADYELPSASLPPLDYEESEPERIERMLRRNHKRKQ
jgi:hypothetical protein